MYWIDKIKQLFGFEAPVAINYSRYHTNLFEDPTILECLKRNGYCVVPFLQPTEVKALHDDFLHILKMSEGQRTDFFWVSAFSPNMDLRQFSKNSLETRFKDFLPRIFNEQAEFMGGTFLVKPPTKEGKNDPHQDSAHVDEAKDYSVYCWVPLIDINDTNGPMYAIKGSHLWGNRYRSTVVPWLYKNILDELLNYGTPAYMKAGEMLIFDSALVHFTPPNTTNEPRPAINYFVKPKSSPLLYYFTDKETPEGTVEEFALSKEFYDTYDWFSRPPDALKIRNLPNTAVTLDKNSLRKIYKKFQFR